MLRSLRRNAPNVVVWVLCLSDLTFELFTRLNEPGVVPIRLSDLEEGDEQLQAAKNDGRSPVEYYFTCTPTLIRYVMRQVNELDSITYLDGDLGFFSDPGPIFEEMGDESVVIIEHRFPKGQERRHVYGTYNVGWLTFRADARGRAALEWWRERCLEWCFDRVDEANERFADQRYLDKLPRLFEGIHVLANRGANLAPWNVGGATIDISDGRVLVDESYPLIFYHFHGLKQASPNRFVAWHTDYGAKMSKILRHSIYVPYLIELQGAQAEIAPFLPDATAPSLRGTGYEENPLKTVARAAINRVRKLNAAFRGLVISLP